MLDTDTKKKIDNCRDILVGKVPDPKSQVEQITIAMIYKFMDDMDRESVELGGKAKFFTGEYKNYSWTKIFDPKMSGVELIAMYGEAITKMNTNKNIPQLFRDIFKNAFLPYRDPETLKSFLKEINQFSYEHSEKLGDAFEYLLSVLGSQGEAGQFRTPRHIIDFIVEVVEPKKGESILDPACGTAGFLIAAYKHILKTNTTPPKSPGGGLEKTKGENGSYAGDLLTPDDRTRLMEQFEGYDISPDMVRLSLVNLYLHGFPNPKIREYDTLTSEEHWGERFDVILANPPFMTPKGGIRPHKRFSIQANRSEVLFVDYMAEHLTITGRAGIIVPEGIIFQSANAYKALRKMLVEENYLFAVVSLPAGVFNPYSGVKTSILLLDKTTAKKAENILFVKIDNDGYDLGAQRRPNGKDDLPEALKLIKEYKKTLNLPDTTEGVNALLIPKTRIAENGEYNLSGDRYRETIVHSHKDWPMVELGEVCEFEYGKPLKEEDRVQGDYPVYGSNGIVGYHNSFIVESPFIVVGRKGSAGSVHYSERNGNPIDTTFFIKLGKEDNLILKYLFFALKELGLNKVNTQAGVPGLNRNDAYKQKIPHPPLDVQKEIVAEIEGYQKIIDGARAVVDSWKPSFKVDPEWPRVALGEVCNIVSGGTPSTNVKEYYENGTIPWLGSAVCKDEIINEITNYITEEGLKNSSAKMLNPLSTTVALVGATIGKTGFLPFPAATNQNIAGLFPKDSNQLLPKFLFYISQTLYNEFLNIGSGKFRMANLSFVRSLKIPLPPLDIQKQIVAEIEREQKIVDGNKELIEIYEKKIKDKIGEVWGK